MKDIYHTIYNNLPILVQNFLVNIYGIKKRAQRYGGDFKDLLRWLESSQWWTEQRIRRYQESELEKLISHSYRTVPYYNEVFNKNNLKPSDINSIEDLKKIPITTKEDIRKHKEKLISRDFSKSNLVHYHTSGTTGKSLDFYVTNRAINFQWAIWWRHKKRFGVEFDSPHALFTGKLAVPIQQNDPPYWRENLMMKQTIFPMQHITPSKLKYIVGRLNKGGFLYYTGYPSILYVLADLIKKKGLEITSPPEIIFTGAETLYDNQRQLISEVFQCQVTDQYGFSEGCGNASRCEKDMFHEDFEFGILECCNEERVSPNEKKGKIIATGFSNFGMPFIRYDVGDIAVWQKDKCSCGRESNVIKRIEGRVEDYVVTPEDRKIRRFDYIFKDTNAIKEAQVVQKLKNEITLRIVRRDGYLVNSTEKKLKKEIASRISPEMKVKFEYVDKIEREENGKFRAVKSELNNSLTS